MTRGVATSNLSIFLAQLRPSSDESVSSLQTMLILADRPVLTMYGTTIEMSNQVVSGFSKDLWAYSNFLLHRESSVTSLCRFCRCEPTVVQSTMPAHTHAIKRLKVLHQTRKRQRTAAHKACVFCCFGHQTSRTPWGRLAANTSA